MTRLYQVHRVRDGRGEANRTGEIASEIGLGEIELGELAA
jgi:hypothetical protein